MKYTVCIYIYRYIYIYILYIHVYIYIYTYGNQPISARNSKNVSSKHVTLPVDRSKGKDTHKYIYIYDDDNNNEIS